MPMAAASNNVPASAMLGVRTDFAEETSVFTVCTNDA
jgi:hypothetical protein